MNFLAAVFDLDGTLVDSNGVWEKIDKDYMEKNNLFLSDEEICNMASMSYEDVAKYMCSKGLDVTTQMLENEFMERAVYEYKNNIKLKPYAFDFLMYLKQSGKKIALATASPKELYEGVLKSNGVYDLFDAFSTTKEAGKEKDFPDVYLLACQKINLLPENCLAFEDTLKGVKSAHNAGMKCVGVYDKYSQKDFAAIKEISDKFIYDFSEMMP